jgi:hypothetical protein
MKKFILLFFATIALSSCTQEVSFNNPSVQGTKDNYFWRAKSSIATVDPVTNTIVLQATSQFETLTLKMPLPSATNPCPITSILGTGSATVGFATPEATFSYVVNGQNLVYKTGTTAQDGQIILSEYDVVNKTISGTYRFNAYNVGNNPLGYPVVNFTSGVFYKIPVN